MRRAPVHTFPGSCVSPPAVVTFDSMAVAELNPAPRGRGRAKAQLTAEFARELGESDLALLASERGIKPPRIAKIRDRHHALARSLAAGATDAQASAITGYDPSRISILKQDPTFKDLMAFYHKHEDAMLSDFVERTTTLSLTAVNEIADRLEDDPDSFSVGTLLEVAKFTADRTGHAPVQRSVNVNATMDIGARMAAARQRLQASMQEEVQVLSSFPEGSAQPSFGEDE